MGSNRSVYHVVPDASGQKWVVTLENNDSFRQEFSTKDEAVRSAKTPARLEEPSHVNVHKSDGNMDYESTYGQDPQRHSS
jgi:hypothetical protein